jgi:hypothetical protein
MSQLRVNTMTNAGGTGPTAAKGHVVQIQEFRGGTEVAVSGSTGGAPLVTITSATFTTVSPSSKLYLHYYSGQYIVNTNSTNARFTFFIDGVDQQVDTDHIFYGDGSFRHVASIPLLSINTLSPGSHTVEVKGSVYNGTATFNYQISNSTDYRRSRLIVMEIAQ